MIKRIAKVIWNGPLMEGNGVINTQGLKNIKFSVPTRFNQDVEQSSSNPEELLISAHAGCFSMALSAELTKNKTPPKTINTTGELVMKNEPSGWKITDIHLVTKAVVPGASADVFNECAQRAKANCPVSKLFSGNCNVTLDAHLEK
ncbi:hypothetical protein CYY_007812 [Polysphondylium violaceum]|uniref:OsmC family peroxiredoxin n=1 Tax=Polysphondylium violaceum TaxID=133409 RepID=A0A8J4UQM6_9MYCE|nr:hypothetical protein CYY_007812 [Polysphondylium violaceum]